MAAKTASPNLAISGLASGMDWATIVTELANAERAPETQWQAQQTTISSQQTAYSTISSDLSAFQLDAETLMDPSFFNSVTAASTNPAAASADGSSGTPIGNYDFNITQLATAAQFNGATNVSQVLAPGNDTSTVTIGAASFSTPVTAGTFTVDGAQVKIATTDSLQGVFDAISKATNKQVTASYSDTTDTITLTSKTGSPITLGSSADSSNFLQVAQLYNDNGSGTENSGAVTSTAALGRVNTLAVMSKADTSTLISGTGEFMINGVDFKYNAGTDTLQDILNNINQSAAGVSASYDPINNRFSLTNTTTGDVGIALQNVSGSFLDATGLTGGTLTHGKNLLYTLNGSSQPIVSQSNTITSASSGITGLAVTATDTKPVTISVATDTATISSTIQKFVTDYNTLQTYMGTQQAVTTGSTGNVIPGTLTGDETTSDIGSSLRNLMASVANIAGTSGTITQLADLGFTSNGSNDTIATSDSSKITSLLNTNLSDIQALFSNTTSGLATKLNSYIASTLGANGTLPTRTADLTQQNTDITTQISNLEAKITSDTNGWDSEFQAMETAEAQTNQELTYLSQGVSNGSL
jgi:flagellar hook-associated protein 2